jgi:hypothetical protein
MEATVLYDKADHLQEVAAYLKKTWFAWEKLRIIYNVVLLAEGLLCLEYLRILAVKSGHLCANLFGSRIWLMIIVFGFLANAFYCFGPVAEVVLMTISKGRFARARSFLYAAGLLFSMFIIFALAIRGYTHISGYLR